MLTGRNGGFVIAGILLAAGRGSRFGGGKLLAPLADGTPVGVQAARNLRSGVDRGLAVVRPEDLELAALLEAEGLEVAFFPRADAGMGASLSFGVSSAPEADGWLVALGDMPFVRPETVRALALRLRAGAWIVAPSHLGRRGHPVGFSRGLLPELNELSGDQGARLVLTRYASRVELLECDDPGVCEDVDTRAALEKRLDREI